MQAMVQTHKVLLMRPCPNYNNLVLLAFRIGRVLFFTLSALCSKKALSQTAVTGAMSGVTLDPSGESVPGVAVHLVNEQTNEAQSTTSDDEGRFRFLSVVPGVYRLEADKTGFASVREPNLKITVTETVREDLHLQLATVVGSVQVSTRPQMLQTDDSALGRVVTYDVISQLPLVTRNFTQIAALSPGVTSGVFNAGELGLGGTAQSQINLERWNLCPWIALVRK
jgi:hypothetical protein